MRRTAVIFLFVMSLSLGMAFAQEPETAYRQTNLVSDLPRIAAHIDRQLINPWGLAFFPGTSASNPSSPVWVSDNNSGFSTLYDPAGVKQGLIVTIPPPNGSTAMATPTGIVANTSKSNFAVKGFPTTAFIFA